MKQQKMKQRHNRWQIPFKCENENHIQRVGIGVIPYIGFFSFDLSYITVTLL